MPAESISQQQLFGIARGIQEGKINPGSASGEAREIAENVSGKSVHDFAATKHKGLPEHKKHKSSSVNRLLMASHLINYGFK